MIRAIVDPHRLDAAELPQQPRDWMTVGHSSRLVICDNVSVLTSEQSDALCRNPTEPPAVI